MSEVTKKEPRNVTVRVITHMGKNIKVITKKKAYSAEAVNAALLAQEQVIST